MIPEFVILDTAAHYRQLKGLALMHEQQYRTCQSEYLVVDLAAEVVECIRDRRYAEKNLRELAGEIQVGHIAGGDYLPPVFAPAVLDLGRHVVRQLEHHRAYMPNAVLPYHLYVLPRPADNTTMVLQRTNELPR